MSVTVEYEYEIDSRVRVRDDAGSFAGERGIVLELSCRDGGKWYHVGLKHIAQTEKFRARHLEPDSSEPESPAPTFPRVIWEGALGDDACYRIVLYRPKELCVEKKTRDAMGGVKWNSIGWGDHCWSRAIAEALMARESESNGSQQAS